MKLSLCTLALGAGLAAQGAVVIANTTLVPRLTIQSGLGVTNQIQYSANLSKDDWVVLTNLVVKQSPSWFVDAGALTAAPRVYRLVSIETDSASPSGMALIPAGSFILGDANDDNADGDAPTNTVTVSAFCLDTNLVSCALWQQVYQWATGNGYSFDNPGSGKATNHPVQAVTWHDVVKWCNARSEMEGWTPCYYTDGTLTTVYRSGDLDLGTNCVNWTGGYRMPTEAEREKAARGGVAGHRFPWPDADTIDWSRANYYADQGWLSYDVNPADGGNPAFASGEPPYTSPVGSFAANGYGLCDMAGNVTEWCWDWYDYGYYYWSPGTDPLGPDSSPLSQRVMRGGSWGGYAYWSRCANRDSQDPTATNNNFGFRCAMGMTVGVTQAITNIALVPRLAIQSDLGVTNQIQCCANLSQPNWVALTNVLVAQSPYSFVDVAAPAAAQRFYRVMGPPALSDGVIIPAGSFTMGDPLDGESDALPLHTVNVSACYMDTNLVTCALWTSVFQWATNHGYSFDHAGSGKAANHPVESIDWYDMVKWCNARSEKEGRMPAYYTDAAQTVVYRTGQVDVASASVNWIAGYRLPTEAEWVKAARGGAAGHRFPWPDADTITWSRANYYADPTYCSYDVNPTSTYNPAFSNGAFPYTSPVGSFPPNGYGLYDMAGNVWEWCWDWYDSAYYRSSPGTDPRGAEPGTYRVLRGGSWGDIAVTARCAVRACNYPTYASDGFGFRCVRGG